MCQTLSTSARVQLIFQLIFLLHATFLTEFPRVLCFFMFCNLFTVQTYELEHWLPRQSVPAEDSVAQDFSPLRSSGPHRQQCAHWAPPHIVAPTVKAPGAQVSANRSFPVLHKIFKNYPVLTVASLCGYHTSLALPVKPWKPAQATNVEWLEYSVMSNRSKTENHLGAVRLICVKLMVITRFIISTIFKWLEKGSKQYFSPYKSQRKKNFHNMYYIQTSV